MSPTNPIGPTNATALPVRRAAPAKTRRASPPASTPSCAAASSPSAIRLSWRARPTISHKPAAAAEANTASAPGGSGARLPRSQWITPPRRLTSTSEISTVIAAEKKMPTMTPARSSECTGSPPDLDAMRNTTTPATTAPAEAKEARPKASPTVPPRPNSCPITAPNAAPLDTPSTDGSARGLRVRAWKPAPATARAPPAMTAAAMRGSLRSRTTTRSMLWAGPRPVSTPSTAPGDTGALPTNRAATAAPATRAASAISASARRRGVTRPPPAASTGRLSPGARTLRGV